MYHIVELSDEELVIITQKELQEWIKDAQEFDGFYGWIIKNSFATKKEAIQKKAEYEKK